MKKVWIITAFASFVLVSCFKGETTLNLLPKLPSTVYDYNNVERFGSKATIQGMIRDTTAQMYSNHSATLGRVLFYDVNLSINNKVSCGTCHIQSLAFADGVGKNKGFKGQEIERNSMGLINPILNNNMFWDSRTKSPLELALQPVFNHQEMGMENQAMLVNKLEKISYYPELFKNAFGSEEITESKISIAMSHFINSVFSQNSKFDEGRKNEFKNFTGLELFGKTLFESERLMCSQCHSGENFSAPDFPGGPYGSGGGMGRGGMDFAMPPTNDLMIMPFEDPNSPRGTANIGLDLNYKDNGRQHGKFKIPSLRNIELTGPYMHDGRFKTLEEVIDHYSHGIKNHPHLDSKFKNQGKAIQLNISENEKQALIAFMKTLTDNNLIRNPKFSDPFKY